MKVKIDGVAYDCVTAKRTKAEVILTVAGLDEKEYDRVFSGGNIVENAEVTEGEWEYDFYAEPEPMPSEDSVWDELDAAYQRGVDSV